MRARPRIRVPEAQRSFNAALGRRIAGARMASGMTQKQLAEAVDIGRSTLGHYEQGVRDCLVISIARIAQVLGISTDALFPRFVSSLKSAPNRPLSKKSA